MPPPRRSRARHDRAALPSVEGLLERVYQPERPQAEAVREALAGAPDDPFARLAELGLVPASWVSDPLRRFASDRWKAPPAAAPTLELARALGADPAGVERAESAAAALVAALIAWESAYAAPTPTPRVWCLGPARPSGDGLILSGLAFKASVIALHAVSLVDREILAKHRARIDALAGRTRNPLLRRAASDAADAWVWEQAVKARLRVPAELPRGLRMKVPAPLQGKPFARCPDPVAPLLAIHATGYLADTLDAQGLWLAAPPLP